MESWRDTTFQRSILVVGVGPLLTLHSFRTGPVLIAHIILIDVQRLTPDLRTVLVALLSNLRLIVLLGLIATLRAFSVLHFGLRGYRVQSLRKGCNRQCRTNPIHAVTAGMVRIAHPLYPAVGLTKRALRLTRND